MSLASLAIRTSYFASSSFISEGEFQVFARLMRGERPVGAVPGASAIGSDDSEMISRVSS